MNIIETSFQELIGVICWNAEWDANLNLSINFGQPSLRIREPKIVRSDSEKVSEASKRRLVSLRGEWLFLVWEAFWKLSIRDFGEVAITSSYKRKRMALARLNGQKLTGASVRPDTGATQLDFDFGGKLAIRRTGVQSNEDVWSLYKPDGYVLSMRGDGKYHYSPGDFNPNEKEYKPIA